jgi:hypothetical protein
MPISPASGLRVRIRPSSARWSGGQIRPHPERRPGHGVQPLCPLPCRAGARIGLGQPSWSAHPRIGPAAHAVVRPTVVQGDQLEVSVALRENGSPGPGVRAAGIRATFAALEEAHILGADTMQLIPGRVQGGAPLTPRLMRARNRSFATKFCPSRGSSDIFLGSRMSGTASYSARSNIRYTDFESLWSGPI